MMPFFTRPIGFAEQRQAYYADPQQPLDATSSSLPSVAR
jgi:hypothetical protein